MPITFNVLLQSWKYEFFSDHIEEYKGTKYRLIVMADSMGRFINDLKEYGVYDEWVKKNTEETLKDPNKEGQLSMEDYL